jgi:hypothetical protein
MPMTLFFSEKTRYSLHVETRHLIIAQETTMTQVHLEMFGLWVFLMLLMVAAHLVA